MFPKASGPEVLIVKLERVTGPLSIEAGTDLVAPAEGVGPGQGDDLSIVESLAVKNLPKVRGVQGGVREQPIRWHRAARLRVDAAKIEGNLHSLQSARFKCV